MKKKIEYEISSGNVFADLGLPNPEELLAKAELARQINNLIKQKKLTQEAAGKLLGIDQPKISALGKGKLSGFSLERLFKFLNLLGQDITIKVSKTKPQRQANVVVNLPKNEKTINYKTTISFNKDYSCTKKEINTKFLSASTKVMRLCRELQRRRIN